MGSMGNKLGNRGVFLAAYCKRLSVAASASAASGRGRRFRRPQLDRVGWLTGNRRPYQPLFRGLDRSSAGGRVRKIGSVPIQNLGGTDRQTPKIEPRRRRRKSFVGYHSIRTSLASREGAG